MDSAAETARTYAKASERAAGTPVAIEDGRIARTWALVSIAESLEAIIERGIETFELDADGHRRYR